MVWRGLFSFPHSCVCEHSPALSLGGCIIASAVIMCLIQALGLAQPLEPVAPLSELGCWRSVMKMVVWSSWMSMQGVCLSWSQWGHGARRKQVGLCCAASHICHGEFRGPIYLAVQREWLWVPEVLGIPAWVVRQLRRGLGKDWNLLTTYWIG